MRKPENACLEDMVGHFCLRGTVESVTPYGSGHINDTFLVTAREGGDVHEYVLQRLSPVAFREPEKVMDNVSRVTAYLREGIARRGGVPERETLTLIPVKEGRYHVYDASGACWRMYLNIAGTKTWQLPESEDIFREAGRAFGAFQTALLDYPADTLHETIPHFHDTPARVEALREALRRDAAGRAAGARDAVDFALARAERAGELVDQLRTGRLPLRVTHNDTKLNNVLMDEGSGRALCVIDLDTVMPGLSAYDFGDAIRFGANTADEDEADLDKVRFSVPMYRAYCEGYLSQAGKTLEQAELASLATGAWMMTYECGCRFLTDHLDGDRYFHVAYPGHNLIRAKNQFALLKDMEKHRDEMAGIIKELTKE